MNILFKMILYLDKLSQNKKKAEKSVSKLKNYFFPTDREDERM
jgi:hypothetical protein